MNYPDISCYREIISNPAGFFKTLKGVEVMRDSRGEISCISGSNSVVFGVRIGRKSYMMKCYTKFNASRENIYELIGTHLASKKSPYLIKFKYLKDEMYVFDRKNKGSYYPILLMENVEGETLGNYLKRCCLCNDHEALTHISREFDTMALWLLSEDFAHSDLKYDNIIVTPQKTLRLIDYDGMYVPSMTGSISTELGTRNFQHPRRNKNFFNVSIDDFSIALISLILHLLAENPALYSEEIVTLSPEELVSGKCEIINRQKSLWLETGECAMFDLARMLGSYSPVLDNLSDTLSLINRNFSDVKKYQPFEVREGMRIICRDGLYGFVNCETGNIIAPVYDDAGQFSHGVAAVKILKKWHYIDKTGRKIIDAKEFDEVGVFKEGFAVVKQGAKYGYINLAGKIVIPLIFDNAYSFSGGYANVKIDQKYGIIDIFGKFVVDPQFELATDLKNYLINEQEK